VFLLRMWELKKSRIRFFAWGWAVKMEGREVDERERVSSIAITLAQLLRMIKDIVLRIGCSTRPQTCYIRASLGNVYGAEHVQHSGRPA